MQSNDAVKDLAGWRLTLAILPASFIFQNLLMPTTGSALNEARFSAICVVHGFVLARAVIALIWRPAVKNWELYVAFLPASLPFFGVLESLYSVLTR